MKNTCFSSFALLLGFLLAIWATTTNVASAEDLLRELQQSAVKARSADWGHWGENSQKYVSWSNHSNRLIPVYSFGVKLDSVSGENSVYRDEKKLKSLYGYLPEQTVNPTAEYFDQTDIYRLQEEAIESGKTCIILMVFDGMDWQTTWAAAIHKQGKVAYDMGRGTGLNFQDYKAAVTDFGYCVTTPHNDGTNADVDTQTISNPGGSERGGYSVEEGGPFPWSVQKDTGYIIGKGKTIKHAYPDSAATATSMTAGIKTYNSAINVDAIGRPVTPLARKLQKSGFVVGVVTSVPISHATPAAAYANNVDRGDYQDISRDLLGLPSVSNVSALEGMDVVIGAGWGEERATDSGQGNNYSAGNRYLADADLKAIDVENGGKYVVAQRTTKAKGSEVLKEAAKKAIDSKHRLFGYFGVKSGHMPYATADGDYDPAVDGNGKAESYSQADIWENPTLAEMTQSALDVLSKRGDKMWLMVEAGEVDWANHSNNLDNSVGAVYSGDEAFLTITKWIEDNVGWDKAAVIVTADHGHYLVLDKPEVVAGEK